MIAEILRSVERNVFEGLIRNVLISDPHVDHGNYPLLQHVE